MSEHSVPSTGLAHSLFPDRPCILSPDPCSTGSRPVPPEATWRPGPAGSTHSPRRVSQVQVDTVSIMESSGEGPSPSAKSFPLTPCSDPVHKQRTRTALSQNSIVLEPSTQLKTDKNPRSESWSYQSKSDMEIMAVGGAIKDKGSQEQNPEVVCPCQIGARVGPLFFITIP